MTHSEVCRWELRFGGGVRFLSKKKIECNWQSGIGIMDWGMATVPHLQSTSWLSWPPGAWWWDHLVGCTMIFLYKIDYVPLIVLMNEGTMELRVRNYSKTTPLQKWKKCQFTTGKKHCVTPQRLELIPSHPLIKSNCILLVSYSYSSTHLTYSK